MQPYVHDTTVDRVMTERSMFGMSTKLRSRDYESKSSFPTDAQLSTVAGPSRNFYELETKKPPTNNLSSICNNFNFVFLNQFIRNIKNRKSVIVSPFSMIQLFIMLYVTAKGRTDTDLQKYFSFTDKAETFKSLVQLNVDLAKTRVFVNSNVICIPETTQLDDKYSKLLSNVGNIIRYNYDTAGKCVKIINDIAAKTTNNMITNVVNDSMLKYPTEMVLINIIYFYSKWKLPFDPSLTERARFYGGNSMEVNMMTQRDGRFNYYEDDTHQILEMDYNDGFFSMGFILPHETTGNIDFKSKDVEHYIQRLASTEINTLKIPKFIHEFKYKVDNVFRENGLNSLFHKLETDLIDVPVEISYIIHGAVIIVDDTGTKSVAYTNMLASLNCHIETKKINFIADHPFLYYIRYKPQNLIIFVGQHF